MFSTAVFAVILIKLRWPKNKSLHYALTNDVMTIFMINNLTGAFKTDVNLFLTIRNCQIVRSRSF